MHEHGNDVEDCRRNSGDFARARGLVEILGMISMENTVNAGACKREVLRGKKLFDVKTAAPCRKSCDGTA